MDKLLKYLNSLPKEERARFVKACGTTEGYLRKAASKGQLLGVATCVSIERESGHVVTRKDLRPDDWAENWPELAAVPAMRRKDDPQPALNPGPDSFPSRKNLLEWRAEEPMLCERAR